MRFDRDYKKYVDAVERQSNGLATTNKDEFLKMAIFYNEIVAQYTEKYVEDTYKSFKGRVDNSNKEESKGTAYDLLKKHQLLTEEINILSEKTNSSFGRHEAMWDSLIRKQRELAEIEAKMMSIIL